MKSILAVLVLFSASAMAGDGGYSNYSCVSASGRTMLNIFSDNYSGSAKPFTVRLLIDGQQNEYSNTSWEDQSIVFDYNTLTLNVQQNGASALTVILKKIKGVDYTATIKAGFLDPREGTEFAYYGNNASDITVNCKYYYQGP